MKKRANKQGLKASSQMFGHPFLDTPSYLMLFFFFFYLYAFTICTYFIDFHYLHIFFK